MTPSAMRAALRAVHEAERDLIDDLRQLTQRHASEHDVFHIGNRLAGVCERHLALVGEHAERYGTELSEDEFAPFAGLLASLRRRVGAAAARSERSAVLLLRDLRNLYVTASECNVAWTILNQGAKAARDGALIDVAYACQQDIGRTIHWLDSRIKQTAPQVLAGRRAGEGSEAVREPARP
jgi:hypothetical protein